MEWRTIESAPKDGSNVLLLTDDRDGMLVVIQGRWDGGAWEPVTLSWHGCGCCGSGPVLPAHWMPLPGKP
jgi:hypothetical protein